MAAIPNDTYVATSRTQTRQQSVLIITANDTQDLEFFYPYYRFIEAGYRVDVATPDGGEFKGKQGMGLKETKALADVNSASYQLLYIPGGKAPAELKKNEDALRITREFAQAKKPISAICHGGQLLAAAGVIQGMRIAAWPEVQDEIAQAGGSFVNEPTVVDGPFITARWPGDLPLHLTSTLKALEATQSNTRLAS